MLYLRATGQISEVVNIIMSFNHGRFQERVQNFYMGFTFTTSFYLLILLDYLSIFQIFKNNSVENEIILALSGVLTMVPLVILPMVLLVANGTIG